jgi:hypothetical protein
MSEPAKQPFEGIHIVLTSQNKDVVKFDAQNKNINIDIQNKQFLKDMMKMAQEFLPQMSNDLKNQAPSNPLEMAKKVADTMKNNGVTLTLSYMGEAVATVGKSAQPTFLHLVTKTKAIAVNSVVKALEMIL